ncbi:MAG: response regulator transcription factor [Nitrospirota bacterium]
MNEVVDIVIADDHQIVRLGLATLLEKEPDFRIVGEAANGPEAVQLVKQLKPRILILDLIMPGMNGMSVTRQVRKDSPDTRIIILSMHANEAYVVETLNSGASGYVLKDSTGNNLVEAIRAVLAGSRYLSPPLSESAIETYVQMTRETSDDLYDALTSREREVLQLAVAGYSNAEIASRLAISPRTVEAHRFNFMHKLGLRKQTDLIRFAVQRGILPVKE